MDTQFPGSGLNLKIRQITYAPTNRGMYCINVLLGADLLLGQETPADPLIMHPIQLQNHGNGGRRRETTLDTSGNACGTAKLCKMLK